MCRTDRYRRPRGHFRSGDGSAHRPKVYLHAPSGFHAAGRFHADGDQLTLGNRRCAPRETSKAYLAPPTLIRIRPAAYAVVFAPWDAGADLAMADIPGVSSGGRHNLTLLRAIGDPCALLLLTRAATSLASARRVGFTSAPTPGGSRRPPGTEAPTDFWRTACCFRPPGVNAEPIVRRRQLQRS